MPTIASRKAAKFWVSLVGLIVTTVVASVPESPLWLKAVSAVLSAVAVFLVPNEGVEPDPEVVD
jgi:hypothetical protein